MISNNVTFIGRLSHDIELKMAGEVPVANFSLAHNRKPSDPDAGTDWIDFVAFGKTAEFASQWFHKGQRVAVQGHLNMREYNSTKYHDDNGNPAKIRQISVIVDSLEFVEPRTAGEVPTGNTVNRASTATAPAPKKENSQDGYDDLPF